MISSYQFAVLLFMFSLLPFANSGAKEHQEKCSSCVNCKRCDACCMNCDNCEPQFYISWACIVAMCIGAGLAIPFSTFLLGILGFTAAGVTAGSLAALWQSTIGAVSSGSLFAILQSIAAAGFSLSGSILVSGTTGAAMCMFCEALANSTGMDMKCSSIVKCGK